VAALISLPLALAIDQPWRLAPDWQTAAIIFWIGVGPTAIATIVYFKLIGSAGPTFMSQLNYLVPCVALVLGVTLLREQPGATAYTGLGLILGGIAISQFRR
jgi:drug/metabolite transporter (DMT)-like permease